MIAELIIIMGEQTERLDELYGLSTEEKDAIIQNDIDTLQKLVDLKNIVISQNNKLEKKRMSLVADIAEVLALPSKDMSLSDLLQVLEGKPEYDEFKQTGQRLRMSLERLKDANEVNRELLETSIEFVQYSLNALRSTLSPEETDIAAIAKATPRKNID